MIPQTVSSIVLGNPDWTAAALLGVAVIVIVLLLGYVGVSRPLAYKGLLVGLKILAVGLIAFCLLNPLWSRKRVKPGENIVLILADESASMQIRGGSGESRGERLKQTLGDQDAAWRVRLAQDFDVRYYSFGERLTQLDGFGELDFQAPASNLGAALDSLRDRYRSLPLAAVILSSDGNITQASDEERRFDAPIFPLLDSADADEQPDVSIRNVSVSQTVFEDAPMTITASFAAHHSDEEQLFVTLDAIGTSSEDQAQSQTVNLTEGEETTVRFQVKPQQSGVLFYRIRVRGASDTEAFGEEPETVEVTLANNERIIAVDRGRHEHRLLYVGGRPNWEHKFLNRALSEDPQLQLVSLIRIARREAKFDFRGRAGESSNSLFRGFKEDPDEETEAYDQPVLVRLNTRNEQELSDGFPKTKEELYEYQAVILDDVEAAFFTHDQIALLDRFVSERGGGVLMLGGRDSFRHGEWHKTPLRDAVPVYIDRPEQNVSGNLTWNLTRDGWLEPWMRLRETEDEEHERLYEMPEFSISNTVRQTKPGARVFAEMTDESGQTFPSMVGQQYGAGRAGAILLGDLWRWSLRRDEGTDDDLGKAWRQMARWLAADVPSRVEASVDWTTVGQTPAVNIKIDVKDKAFQPQENAAVRVSVTQPDGTNLQLDATPSLAKAGLFETTYVPRMPGAYKTNIAISDENGLNSGMTEVGWATDPAADEFQQTSVDESFLSQLAEETGGEVVPVNQLEQFVTTLPTRDMPVTEIQTSPIWHTPWMLLAALICLAAEWGLRRWKGLA